MKLMINGTTKSVKAPLNIQQCLEQEGYEDMMIAVARNGTFVPKGNYANTLLNDNDEIEIVAPMQGG